MNLKVYGACCALLWLVACHAESPGEDSAGSIRKPHEASESTPVTVVLLKRQVFRQELICNGVAAAHLKSSLSFNTSGTIDRVFVRNGDRVRKGDTLVTLLSQDAWMAYRSAELNVQRAEMALDRRLIEFGFRLADTARMNRATLHTLCVNTGFTEARIGLERARLTLDACSLRAPFSGRVAQMACIPHEPAPGACCTLLDDRTVDIGFSLLETEIDFVRQGCDMTVSPYHDPDRIVSARITSINPAVDRNGQIFVTAEAANNGDLIDGMHVKVVLSRSLDDQWVVPKSAVTVRDNQDVVFRYVNGRSAWTYVRIVESNSTEHAIVPDTDRNACLTEGDTIIVSGHINMGDDTPVHLVM